MRAPTEWAKDWIGRRRATKRAKAIAVPATVAVPIVYLPEAGITPGADVRAKIRRRREAIAAAPNRAARRALGHRSGYTRSLALRYGAGAP